MARIISFVTLAISALCTAQAACPPAAFNAKQNAFSAAKFFDGRWFPLKQLPVSYQPEDEFYCVSAKYKIEKTNLCKLIGCDDVVVRVSNSARKGSINGSMKSAKLNGIIKNPATPTKASVGPSFLPSIFYGPYWVVEAGSYSDLLAGKSVFEGENYEWAIISVGVPAKQTTNGCLPGTGRLNPRGVWLFSREPIVSDEISSRIEALAAAKGFDVTALKKVVHEGCRY